MEKESEHIKTRRMRRCGVHREKEVRHFHHKDGTTGTTVRYRWRGEVVGTGTGGSWRLRKWFNTRDEALAWYQANQE